MVSKPKGFEWEWHKTTHKQSKILKMYLLYLSLGKFLHKMLKDRMKDNYFWNAIAKLRRIPLCTV